MFYIYLCAPNVSFHFILNFCLKGCMKNGRKIFHVLTKAFTSQGRDAIKSTRY